MVHTCPYDSPAQEKVASCPRVTLVDCGGTSVQLKEMIGEQCEAQYYHLPLVIKVNATCSTTVNWEIFVVKNFRSLPRTTKNF